MQILVILGMYFDAAVVFVKNFLLLFRWVLTILWLNLLEENNIEKDIFLTVVHRGRQRKSEGRPNEKALVVDNRIFFSYFSLISIHNYHPQMQQNILLIWTQFFVA